MINSNIEVSSVVNTSGLKLITKLIQISNIKPSSKRPKVLVVDDSENNIMLQQHFLKNHAQIYVAVDGVQALQTIKKEHFFDLILMDIQMPNMDGIECVNEIRKWEKEQCLKPNKIYALTVRVLD